MSVYPQFGRIPYSLVDSGVLASLTGSDAKTLLALAAHTAYDWTCRPSIHRIVKLTGLARSTVCESLKRLKSVGAIEVTKGGGRGRSNVYRLNYRPSQPTDSDAKTVHPDSLEQSDATPETVRFDSVNSSPQQTPTDGTERTERNKGGRSPSRSREMTAEERDALNPLLSAKVEGGAP